MWEKLNLRFGSPLVRKLIKCLPDYGQIYTVKRIANESLPGVDKLCILDELCVSDIPASDDGESGLPVEFYVEVDPPQEDVQSIVNQIITEAPVRVLV